MVIVNDTDIDAMFFLNHANDDKSVFFGNCIIFPNERVRWDPPTNPSGKYLAEFAAKDVRPPVDRSSIKYYGGCKLTAAEVVVLQGSAPNWRVSVTDKSSLDPNRPGYAATQGKEIR